MTTDPTIINVSPQDDRRAVHRQAVEALSAGKRVFVFACTSGTKEIVFRAGKAERAFCIVSAMSSAGGGLRDSAADAVALGLGLLDKVFANHERDQESWR